MRQQVIEVAAKEIWGLLQDLRADPRECLSALSVVMDATLNGWEDGFGQPPNDILLALRTSNKAALDHMVEVSHLLRATKGE